MTGFTDFKDFVFWIVGLINLAIPVIGALALLVFIWGLVKFIYQSGDSRSHADGKNLMIWGVVALFIMVTYLGIINLGQNVLGMPRSSVLPLIQRTP